MYKIISVTDKDGNDKNIESIRKHANGIGEFYYLDMLKSGVLNNLNPHCYFAWNDDSDQMMRTSNVESISEWDNKIKIVTRNSVYVFERIGE